MDRARHSGTKKAATFRSRLLVKAFDLQAFSVLLQGLEEVVPAAGTGTKDAENAATALPAAKSDYEGIKL